MKQDCMWGQAWSWLIKRAGDDLVLGWLASLVGHYRITFTLSLPGRSCDIDACRAVRLLLLLADGSVSALLSLLDWVAKWNFPRSGVPSLITRTLVFGFLFLSVCSPRNAHGSCWDVTLCYFLSIVANGKDFVARSVTEDLWLLVRMRH